MFVIKHPDAAVMTTTDAKKDLPGAFKVAEQTRVYVTRDGRPIGGLVSMEMMQLLERALAEREERRKARANWPVRVIRLSEDAPDYAESMTAEERLGMMGKLASNAYSFRDGDAE